MGGGLRRYFYVGEGIGRRIATVPFLDRGLCSGRSGDRILPMERSPMTSHPEPPPAAASSAPIAEPSPARIGETPAANRGTILFADDDASWSETAAGTLRDAGFEVHLAHDGDVAARLLESETPVAVILDVHLPRRNGVQLLQDFRARNRLTPVVMISGDDQAAIQDRAGRGGFSLPPQAGSVVAPGASHSAPGGR